MIGSIVLRAAIFAVAFVCAFAVFTAPAVAGRVALVLGNANYEHTVPLANPRNDAEAISDALTGLGFEVFDGFDLGRAATEDLIRDFARAAGDATTAVLFYAGHGLEVGGVNYLVPVDAQIRDEADLKFETINLTDILQLMERENRTNLIFLDACRDNPMAGNLARSMGTRSAFVGRGLARVDTGVGTMIVYATQPGNVALDGVGRHSPFTSALLSHIATPALDVEIMMRRVRRDVMDQTAGQQVPWSSSSLTGSFAFKLQEDPPVVSETPQIAALVNPDLSDAPRRETAATSLDVRPPEPAPAPLAEPALVADDLPDVAVQVSAKEIAQRTQAELNRLGCDAGVEDGIWGRKSRSALERLSEHAPDIVLATLDPSEDLLRQMQQLEGRICPLVCAATEELVGDSCVQKTCPAGQRLSSKGACYTPQTTTSRSNSRPTRSQSSCFQFNGQTFCN
ncbi:caspase domain-containing protein [Marivita sp.]|uniref:caspase family protein n=1 Tax=Marivita sp. TaxID=2003365 RepID=UPI0026156A97|nr:caspase domain-containing protein [Marivita sp.]